MKEKEIAKELEHIVIINKNIFVNEVLQKEEKVNKTIL
jgi:hypothetical protein